MQAGPEQQGSSVKFFYVAVMGAGKAKKTALITAFVKTYGARNGLKNGNRYTCQMRMRGQDVHLQIADGEIENKPDACIILGEKDCEQSAIDMRLLVAKAKESCPGSLIVLVCDNSSPEAFSGDKSKVGDLAIELGIRIIGLNIESSFMVDTPFWYVVEQLLFTRDSFSGLSARVEVMTCEEIQRALIYLSAQPDFGKDLQEDFCDRLYLFLATKLMNKKQKVTDEWVRVFIGASVLLEHYQKFTPKMLAEFSKFFKDVLPKFYRNAIFTANTVLSEIEVLFKRCS